MISPRVTHYFRRPISSDGWVHSGYLVRKPMLSPRTELSYFLNTPREGQYRDSFTTSEVRRMEGEGVLKRLEYAHPITEAQRVWLAPNGHVFIASRQSPIDDPYKILIDFGPDVAVPSFLRQRREAGMALVECRTFQRSVQSKTLGYEIGSYLNSSTATTINTPYDPACSKDLRKRVLDRCREVAGHALGRQVELSLRAFPYQEHRFSSIENRFRTGNLALLFEVVFETPHRSNWMDIIPLGSVNYLSLVYYPNSLPSSQLNLRDGDLLPVKHNKWIKLLGDCRAQLAVPAGQAVDDLVQDAISYGEFPDDRETACSQIKTLADWLRRTKSDGIVACDIGIGLAVWKLLRDSGEKVCMSRVPYGSPLNVGIAFKRDERIWGEFLRLNLSEDFFSSNDEVQASWTDLESRFPPLGMTWCPSLSPEEDVGVE